MPEEAKPEGDNQEQAEELDFDAWLGNQPANVKTAYERKTTGLHSALSTEREQRKELAKQLRDATGKAEQGSELAKRLEEISGRAEQAERRAAFYEEAGKPEIGCANPKAAFLVASADDLFTKSGEPDWKAIKAAAPELFAAKRTPPGNAGNGQGSHIPAHGGMNQAIREAAGRG